MISFTTTKDSVLEILKHMKAGLKNNGEYARQIFCEVTITKGNVKFAGNGYTQQLQCETKGVAKFSMPMFYLEDVIKKYKGKTLKFEVEKDWIKLDSANFHANVSLIEDDTILRTIDLPMNYTDKELLQLPQKGYTIEEIEFNNLFPKIQAARIRLETNLDKVSKMLSVYGVQRKEIEKMVNKKLKTQEITKV